jgi:hypothetical protein
MFNKEDLEEMLNAIICQKDELENELEQEETLFEKENCNVSRIIRRGNISLLKELIAKKRNISTKIKIQIEEA